MALEDQYFGSFCLPEDKPEGPSSEGRGPHNGPGSWPSTRMPSANGEPGKLLINIIVGAFTFV